MGNWRKKINVKDHWAKYEKDGNFQEFKVALIEILNAAKDEIAEVIDEDEIFVVEHLIEEISATEDEEEFDDAWENFYDWADTNHIWVATAF